MRLISSIEHETASERHGNAIRQNGTKRDSALFQNGVVQTFPPYPDFAASLKALDYRRLRRRPDQQGSQHGRKCNVGRLRF